MHTGKITVTVKCLNCYDKGYFTIFQGASCSSDFLGDDPICVEPLNFKVKLCTCSRGKDLNKFFNIKSQYKSIF